MGRLCTGHILPLALLTLLLQHTERVNAATWWVPDDAGSIQEGIDLAVPGDSIRIRCGTYYEHHVELKAGVALLGETGDPDCVVIDGQSLGTVLLGESLDASTLIAGITVSGGDAGSDFGGGFRFQDSSAMIRDCRFTLNRAQSGGGGYIHEGSPTLRYCEFSQNEAVSTGGFRFDGDFLLMEHCIIHENVAEGWSIGGLFAQGGEVVLRSCEISSNTTSDYGGGVVLNFVEAEIRDCLISENSAVAGGGLLLTHSSVFVYDSQITNNSAEQVGGGIQLEVEYDGEGHFEAHFSKIRDNVAPSAPNGNHSSVAYEARVYCCDLDSPTGLSGIWLIFDDDCETASCNSSFSELKALYR